MAAAQRPRSDSLASAESTSSDGSKKRLSPSPCRSAEPTPSPPSPSEVLKRRRLASDALAPVETRARAPRPLRRDGVPAEVTALAPARNLGEPEAGPAGDEANAAPPEEKRGETADKPTPEISPDTVCRSI
mmetsp:Transcript_11448/g.35288  ORF Transcript_11448/g.35288 Transcript_11448/m.35288 type:complete len:131 (+) Transcript_11448:145-537(+)